MQGSHVEFQNLTTASWSAGINSSRVDQGSQTNDVVFENVNAQIFFIGGASAVSVIGGSIGPTVNNASQITSCYLCTYPAHDILIDHVYFHDYTRTDPKKHMECLHVYPAQRLTIRNSRFRNCAIMNVFLSNFGSGGDLADITIENNWFDRPARSPAGCPRATTRLPSARSSGR